MFRLNISVLKEGDNLFSMVAKILNTILFTSDTKNIIKSQNRCINCLDLCNNYLFNLKSNDLKIINKYFMKYDIQSIDYVMLQLIIFEIKMKKLIFINYKLLRFKNIRKLTLVIKIENSFDFEFLLK